MKVKVSVYMNEEQRLQVSKNATQCNSSISEYLLHKGLEEIIQSDQTKSSIASLACRLYHLSEGVEDTSLRNELKALGGELYGIFEN